MHAEAPPDDHEWIGQGYIYSPRAAAEAVEIGAGTLRAWARAGLLRYSVVGRRYLLHASDVDLLLTLRLDHGVAVPELRLVLLERTNRELRGTCERVRRPA
ncbi:hypothetical protein [Actinocorallia longicatena]|uniref:Excisionase family DNA binding protein n=1 Tax=Actinocorallia longicatena TaxID=111803 RepID=A0ABP6QD28_9ACTN